jgi:hypothetical protein
MGDLRNQTVERRQRDTDMAEDTRKQQLLELFTTITNKKTIVEPMRKVHGTLRDRDAVEREIALIMREVLDQGYFKTKLAPRQLAKLVVAYYDGKNDTEIARALGDEKLSKTVARARSASNSSGSLISRCRSIARQCRSFLTREDHEGDQRGPRRESLHTS